jgi:predicted component of type VI protein secretion system
MPYRISAFVLAVLANSFAVAIELGTQGPASAAECLEKFSSGGDQAGHWYYSTDRVNNRKCWFFEKAATDPPPPPASTAPPPPNGGAEESWFSQFATGVQQTFLGTQDAPPASATATGNPGANPTKMSANTPKQRSRPASPPDTHRAAGSGLQISPEDRDALFQEFLRRYELEKSIHADPRP